jgi:short-subunit dehydrogenase
MKSTKTALITGASDGLGREFARLLAEQRYNLVVVARSEDKLQTLAVELNAKHGVQVRVLAQDLSTSNAADDIYATLQREGISVDVLVNNAGYGVYGGFQETKWEEELGMMNVNMLALVRLTKLFMPAMVAAGSGKILNVSSSAAFQPGPFMALYFASKAFVLSFSEAIAEELAGTGVGVTVLCPGATETGFQNRADMHTSNMVKGKKLPTAREVAEYGIQALMSGKVVAVPGLQNKVSAQAVRFTPRAVVRKIARSVVGASH